MRLLSSSLLLASLVSLAACTGQSSEGGGATSATTSAILSESASTDFCTADSTVFPIDLWTPNLANAFPWPNDVAHMEVIEMRWSSSYFIVWGIGDGNTVQFLYRVAVGNAATFNAAMTTAFSNITGSRTWGGQGLGGNVAGPHPVGPGPGGGWSFTAEVARRVMLTAQSHQDLNTFGRNAVENLWESEAK